MIGYIYKITDITNGKQYVGQHHYDKEELDPNYHGSGIIITKIFKKRPETLKEEYLKTCYSQRELDEWEKYFIFMNNTIHPNGYNLTEGGGFGILCEESRMKISESMKGKNVGKRLSEETKRKLSEAHKGKYPSEETRRKMSEANKGKIVSEETRRKLSEANKGYQHTEEARRKMSEAAKGRVPPNKGKHPSEEARRKMSESAKKTMTPEHRKRLSEIRKEKNMTKTVLQFTKDFVFVKEWVSLRECGRNGFDYRNISACCHGRLKQYKGYIWRYKD